MSSLALVVSTGRPRRSTHRCSSKLLALLVQLRQRYGLSFVFISHGLAVVRTMSPRVLVMKDGDIPERGEALALFDAPAHRYTRALLASTTGTSAADPRERLAGILAGWVA